MIEITSKPVRFLLQTINYGVFMAFIGYFATAPSVRLIADDEAMITIAFAHAGELREPCRMLSQQELNQLAPNMRKIDDCPRERSPVTFEALLDGKPFFSTSLQAPGIFEDGGVDVFHSAKIRAGMHRLSLKMNDSVRVEGFNHSLVQEVSVDPAPILLVGFDKGLGFIVRADQD